MLNRRTREPTDCDDTSNFVQLYCIFSLAALFRRRCNSIHFDANLLRAWTMTDGILESLAVSAFRIHSFAIERTNGVQSHCLCFYWSHLREKIFVFECFHWFMQMTRTVSAILWEYSNSHPSCWPCSIVTVVVLGRKSVSRGSAEKRSGKLKNFFHHSKLLSASQQLLQSHIYEKKVPTQQ